jgi:hypothetical protein
VSDKYHLTYQFKPHPDGLEREQVPEGHGASDAVIVLSIIYPSDGSYSFSAFTYDGRAEKKSGHPEKLAPAELFKAWLMFAGLLKDNEGLDQHRREFCRAAWDAFWANVGS